MTTDNVIKTSSLQLALDFSLWVILVIFGIIFLIFNIVRDSVLPVQISAWFLVIVAIIGIITSFKILLRHNQEIILDEMK